MVSLVFFCNFVFLKDCEDEVKFGLELKGGIDLLVIFYLIFII